MKSGEDLVRPLLNGLASGMVIAVEAITKEENESMFSFKGR